MYSVPGQNSKGKTIGLSILAGIGSAIGGFLIGTVLTFLLMAVYFSSIGTFSDMGPMMAIVVSPIIGLLAAIVIGILVGRWTNKRLSEKK